MPELTRPGERGIALVAALWFSVAVAGIAASFIMLARAETMRSRNMVDGIRGRAALDAGLERAVIELTNPTVRPGPQGTRVAWAFDQAAIAINITGESAKIDLNAVDSKLVAALVEELGGDEDLGERIGDAIVDWRDEDSLSRPHGAEARDYRMADRAGGPTNAPFSSVEELRDVLPVDAELYPRLRGYFTVATGVERPELDLAPPIVRRAAASAGPAEGGDEAPEGASESGADEATGEGPVDGGDSSFTDEELADANADGSGLSMDEVGDAGAGNATPDDETGQDRDRRRRSEGFTDPANLYAIRIDVRLVDGYEAHADAVVWLQEGPVAGRPYRLVHWEPSPLRLPETP